MSVTLFRRPERQPGPPMPSGELNLQEPPELPEVQSGFSGMITYLPMALSSLAMVMIFLRPGMGGGGTIMYFAMGMMVLAALGMLAANFLRASSERKRQMSGSRRDYLRYLGQVRRQVRKTVVAQRRAQTWRHPEPTAVWSLVRTSRLWELRPDHPDFGEVRIAVGDQQLGTKIAELTTKPVEDLEPLSAHALRRFIRAYATVSDQPVPVYLRAYARVLLRGDLDAARGMVRSIVAQLAVLHAPQDLRIVVLGREMAHWEWAKWLPHCLHPTDTDGAGPVRLVAETAGELEGLLGEQLAGRPFFDRDAMPTHDEPYVVVLMDGAQSSLGSRMTGSGYRNVTVIDLGEALDWQTDPRTLLMRVTPETAELVRIGRAGKEDTSPIGRPDFLSPARAESLARLLAPYRLAISTDTTEPLASDFELTTLLNINDLRGYDVAKVHAKRFSGGARLRVPIGVTGDGTPIELDIKESAQGGQGPHGMLIGATGSGKSELLRTLVLALALTHSSETLNFVLVDFKGGATFLGLDELPHTSAVITNLADEASLVERMKDALHGELIRRQELLRKAGNFSSATEYEKARADGADLDPLPTLFVVVDEFSELLAAHREFMDLFVMIGRLGRSLSVHLLLASQRLDEGRMHQLESHLSYRIGLRTFSAMESRGVLGVPDAHQLPSQPGAGYLKTDVDTLIRFKAAYVSGTYRQARREVRQAVVARQIVPYGTSYVPPREPPMPEEPEVPQEEGGESLLEIAVQRLIDSGPPAHRVWLPPLDVSPTLEQMLPQLAIDPERGLNAVDAAQHTLQVQVGVIDRPFEQRHEPLLADLSGSGGHVFIAGGPQSGKSTLLATLITTLALTHTPREVQFYGLDFGGGMLSSLAGLPHVGGVTGRLDIERMMRTINQVNALLEEREQRFAQLGVDSMTTYRRRRAAGELADEPYCDVFLVVDGWATIRQDFMELVPQFTLLATRGLNYGIHLIITATRGGEVASGLRDQLGTRFELRLGDAVESTINMRAAATVPKIPGRGLTDDQAHFLAGLPRLDGPGDTAEGTQELITTIASAWHGPPAPRVKMLPAVLDVDDLPAPTGQLRVPLGLSGEDIEPLWHDFTQHPHLLIAGDDSTGKTNLLQHIAASVARQYTPDQARITFVDFRRELFDVVPEDYRLGYAVSKDIVREAVAGTSRAMRERLPGPEISPARLSKRDWWTGPELFLIVDDYDMLSSDPSDNPFVPMLECLAQGQEVGLHLIVARSANGLSRAMYDPLVRRLLEVNTPAVLLSCPPSEGQVFHDVRPKKLPTGRAQYITRRKTVQLQTPHRKNPA
ncbi:type VII secretion protein EccCa [Saccharopolyspora shandongensis]|uniref:type VII secretion protein EccCa n=1 Tax=Saccharopolyspora shandongensis TaxID=418495 RepID=UPI0033D9464E